MFYPGVAERELAGVAAIDAGKFLNGFNIQIDRTVELIEVGGRFLYADAKPVAGERVKFKPVERDIYEEIAGTTDAQGRFTIGIPKGARGKLHGEKYFRSDETGRCARLRRAKEAVESGALKTDEIEIAAAESLLDVELTFPFPFCPKPAERK